MDSRSNQPCASKLNELQELTLHLAIIIVIALVLSLLIGATMRESMFAEADNDRWYRLGSTDYTFQQALIDQPKQLFIVEDDGSLKKMRVAIVGGRSACVSNDGHRH